MAAKRKYDLVLRAQSQANTRRRIVEATAALHEEVGPARTTITAVARRAGVERLTVYRHFPKEGDLLRACQRHFLDAHPVPDPEPWSRIDDPRDRLRAVLTTLYAYYRDTEGMTANVLRDAPTLPALMELLEGVTRYFAAVHTLLMRDWPADADPPLIAAAIGHALEFETWRSLTRQSLSDVQAVEVMTRCVTSLAGPRPRSRR